MYIALTVQRNRLGTTFILSLLIHAALLVLIAHVARPGRQTPHPEVERFAVELLEVPQREATRETPEKRERIAEQSRKVAREMAPKKPDPVAVAPRTLAAPSPVEVVGKGPGKASTEPLSQTREPLLITDVTPPLTEKGGEEAEKPRLSLSDLTPSYEQLALQYKLDKDRREVEEGNEVSLNTTEFKYVSYFTGIKRKIAMVWTYPELARTRGLQGRLTLRFILDRGGQLRDVVVVESSGSSLLDEGALQAVKKAAPFHELPETLGETLPIIAEFQYQLSPANVR